MPIRKRCTGQLIPHRDMFVVRDAKGRVNSAVRRESTAQQLCKGQRGWSYERVPQSITEKARLAGL